MKALNSCGAAFAVAVSGAALAAPVYQNQRGHPVAFSSNFFDALSTLDGNVGARYILNQHADRLTVIDTEDAGVLKDIDTPRDLV